MSNSFKTAVITLATASLVVLTGTAAVVTYILHQWYAANPSPGIRQQRIQVYHDITMNMIRLNREVVELDEEESLRDSHERLVLNQESVLDGPLDDVTQAYHGGYYIISTDVRDAIDEYINYVVTYHEMGFNAGKLLQLSGTVVQTMRNDLGLKDIFPGDVTDSEIAEGVDARENA